MAYWVPKTSSYRFLCQVIVLIAPASQARMDKKANTKAIYVEMIKPANSVGGDQ